MNKKNWKKKHLTKAAWNLFGDFFTCSKVFRGIFFLSIFVRFEIVILYGKHHSHPALLLLRACVHISVADYHSEFVTAVSEPPTLETSEILRWPINKVISIEFWGPFLVIKFRIEQDFPHFIQLHTI